MPLDGTPYTGIAKWGTKYLHAPQEPRKTCMKNVTCLMFQGALKGPRAFLWVTESAADCGFKDSFLYPNPLKNKLSLFNCCQLSLLNLKYVLKQRII